LENLNGIQWVYGAGQPTAAHWIPELKKIQNAGKLIHIDVVPEDLDVLLKELKPEGVMYNVICSNEDDARDILKMVENYKK
ncbi:MAG: trimethylamine corrinoid protein 2, partial [Clostridiaceae bacterium]|nr:trimethylamine corrinoid protein 2 [Clostridiaceae bacterium]